MTARGEGSDAALRAARGFLAARGGARDARRAAALVAMPRERQEQRQAGERRDAFRAALAAEQTEAGAFALPEFPGALAGTLYALATLDDLGALSGEAVARAVAWLEREQTEAGSWVVAGAGHAGHNEHAEHAETVVTGLLAGYLAKTPYARPAGLRRAGRFLGAHWSPAQVRTGDCGAIAGFAHFFANTPHESADAALQWCGRELERGYRAGRLSAPQVARILTLCDTVSLPGARLGLGDIVVDLVREQAGDGGWEPAAPLAARLAATWAAAVALSRAGAPRFASAGAARQASASASVGPRR